MITKNLLIKFKDKLLGVIKLFSNSLLSAELFKLELKLLTPELKPLKKPWVITKLE